jgi:hypothetical protein
MGIADWKLAGHRHAGLYMLLSRALQMAVRRGGYDVVIRGRFDLVPLVPLSILSVWATPDPVRSASAGATPSSSQLIPSWVLDTGAACEAQGFWWPRTAVLRDGVIVAHMADTRFKLFSWQYCDWLHVGTFATMSKLAGLHDWAMRNYADSGAQFIEHVWAIDQGVRFYPMQLYLKILRETRKKPKQPNKQGKRVIRIRMHLFG